MRFDLFDEVKRELRRTDIDPYQGMPDISPAIRLFLGQLSLLQGIPLYYLLPDEKYLAKTEAPDKAFEQGCIRMFRLDKEWIACLLNGALSIGQDEDKPLLLAKAMAGNYAAEVFYNETKEKIKKQLYGLYGPDEYEEEMNKRLAAKNILFLDSGQKKINGRLADNGQPAPTVAQSNWCYTGFFMRSTILASWIGVEVIAKGTDSNAQKDILRPLQVVRFERVARDMILCICEGSISQIEITQPHEAVHFEVKEKVAMRNNAIDVKAMAASLKINDSASFAGKVLSKPTKVTIDIKWEEDPNNP